MIVMTINFPTGDWAADYVASKIKTLTTLEQVESESICAVSVFSKKAGDTPEMLFAATKRIQELYLDTLKETYAPTVKELSGVSVGQAQ